MTPSDEPQRLATVIAGLFAGQTGSEVPLAGGPGLTVLAGADAHDDCAVLRVHQAADIVVGSDYVRGAKFHLYEQGLLDGYDVGWYLTGANFSDVAAMGATPAALLSVVRYPQEMTDYAFANVMAGIRDGCAAVGASNVGGDIGTAERLILSATALGIVEQGRAIMRSTARSGQLVCTTGPTGIAGAALAYHRATPSGTPSLAPEDEEALLKPWRRAQAKIRQGQLIQNGRLATACVDTSDGLNGALRALATSSHIGIRIDATELPTHRLVQQVSQITGQEPHALVLGDSVDFELAFTARRSDEQRLRRAFDEAELPLHIIGITTGDPDELTLAQPDGTTAPLPGTPWRHT